MADFVLNLVMLGLLALEFILGLVAFFKFRSDSSVNGRGFHIRYVTSESEEPSSSLQKL